MKNLKQYKNFVKRELKITDSRLFYNVSKFGNANEVDIPFESIDGEKVTHKSANHFLLIIALFAYIIAITIQISFFRGGNAEVEAGLIWAAIGSVFFVLYWTSRQNFWKIKLRNNSYIYIHKSIPSKSATDQFLLDLMESRNQFLKENYAVIDENLGYEDQLNNLKWLKSINAITKEEFKQKYAELKRIVKPDKRHIGFGK